MPLDLLSPFLIVTPIIFPDILPVQTFWYSFELLYKIAMFGLLVMGFLFEALYFQVNFVDLRKHARITGLHRFHYKCANQIFI